MNGIRWTILLVALGVGALASPSRAGVRAGLLAGPLASSGANGSGDGGGLTRDPETGWSGGAGLLIEQPLARGLGLVAGFEYAQLPDRARVSTAAGLLGPTQMNALWSIRQHVLLVPVRIEWRRGPLRAGVGPQVRFLLSAWRTSSDSRVVALPASAAGSGRPNAGPAAQIIEDVGTFDGEGDATRLYERVALSALGSLGVAWPAGRHELRAELRLWTDLTDATKDLGGGERATSVQLALGGLW